jgi:branched-chain amino acid transport system ATP-binding protein
MPGSADAGWTPIAPGQIEHDMDIALEVSQHVTVLHYGRVIADGLRDAVKADPQVREIYLGA